MGKDTKKCKETIDKKTIDDAIAHLRGYASMVHARTGYFPVAVDNTIKKLKKIKC